MKFKSLLAWGMASCIGLGIASCSLIGGDNPDEMIEMYPVKVSKNAWSFVDKDGNIVFEDEFKHRPTPVIDGHFVVEEGDYYTFYEAGKKPKAVAEGLKDAGYFYDGVIPVVMPKERITLLNGSGKTVATIEPVSGKEITKISAGAVDGLFKIANEDDEFGFVNTKGKVVIAPKYKRVSYFSDGYAWAAKERDNDEVSYVIIDKNGKEVGKLKNGWTPESPFVGGKMLATDEDGRYGFANTKGEVEKRLPEKVEGIADFNEDYMIYRNEGSYGLWKLGADQPEIKAKYDMLVFFNDKYMLAYNDDRSFLIDYKGEKKVEFDDYKNVMALSGKGFDLLAREGSHYILINEEGKPVGKEEFKDISVGVDFTDWVYSDYFNVEGMVQQLVADITKTGYGKYNLGESATKFNLSVDDYKWTNQMSLDQLEGYRYTIQPIVYFDERIVDWNYGYYYDTNYFINPNAKISGIALQMSAQTSVWDDAKTKIVDALKNKGFKVQDSNSEGTTSMSQGNTNIYITGSGSYIVVGITSEPIEVEPATEAYATEEAVAVGEADYDEYYD